ncbi:hypothetical protein CsSME_00023617 [Camellia sinensis var. sinensis]
MAGQREGKSLGPKRREEFRVYYGRVLRLFRGHERYSRIVPRVNDAFDAMDSGKIACKVGEEQGGLDE